MKLPGCARLDLVALSLPVRGAWVEIDKEEQRRAGKAGRSPCGERGLKFLPGRHSRGQRGVAPRAGSVG